MNIQKISKASDVALFFILNGVAGGGLFWYWYGRFIESEINTPAPFLRQIYNVLMIYTIVSFLFMLIPSLLVWFLYRRPGFCEYTELWRHRPLITGGCYIMASVTCSLPHNLLADGGAPGLLFIICAPFLILFSAVGKK